MFLKEAALDLLNAEMAIKDAKDALERANQEQARTLDNLNQCFFNKAGLTLNQALVIAKAVLAEDLPGDITSWPDCLNPFDEDLVVAGPEQPNLRVVRDPEQEQRIQERARDQIAMRRAAKQVLPKVPTSVARQPTFPPRRP